MRVNSRFEASFRLKNDAAFDGMICAARSLPFSTKSHVEDEVKSLLREGIIFPVTNPSVSASIVPVVKQSGAARPIRLCRDYFKTINRVIDSDHIIFHYRRSYLRKFLTVNYIQCLILQTLTMYLQIKLSPESQLLTCISTHVLDILPTNVYLLEFRLLR